MRILLFSHDKTLFQEGSESQHRMAERGKICDALTIIVPTSRGFSEAQLAKSVRVIPTNSRSRFWSFWDLKKVGRKVIELSFRPTSRNPDSKNEWIPDRACPVPRYGIQDDTLLIISQDPFEFGWIAYGLGKRHGILWQVELHGDFYSTGYWKWSGIGNFFRHYLGKRVLRAAPCIRAVSERLRSSLVWKLGIPDSRIVVFPVETEMKRYLEAPRSTFLQERYGNFDFFLLNVSRLVPVKNVGMQIRALHDIVRKYPKTALVIVGEGSERPVLEMAARHLQVAQNVIFAGAQADLAAYLMSADVFLFTSHAESWGRAAVEAMAGRLAVVMTDVGLAGELLTNGRSGIVIPRGDEKALVRATIKLREDTELRHRLGEAAREAVRKLPTHEEMLEKYKESWRKCAASS